MDIASQDSSPGVQLLMRELMHRISNEFASAISMVSITAARCSNAEAKEALAGVQRYLEQYARVHHALRMPEPGLLIDCSAHLQELCRSMSRSKLSARNIELAFIDNPLLIASERCWILAMIVYELITNSARHAFGHAGGKIQSSCCTVTGWGGVSFRTTAPPPPAAGRAVVSRSSGAWPTTSTAKSIRNLGRLDQSRW